jgi:hypothetical protein
MHSEQLHDMDCQGDQIKEKKLGIYHGGGGGGK